MMGSRLGVLGGQDTLRQPSLIHSPVNELLGAEEEMDVDTAGLD